MGIIPEDKFFLPEDKPTDGQPAQKKKLIAEDNFFAVPNADMPRTGTATTYGAARNIIPTITGLISGTLGSIGGAAASGGTPAAAYTVPAAAFAASAFGAAAAAKGQEKIWKPSLREQLAASDSPNAYSWGGMIPGSLTGRPVSLKDFTTAAGRNQMLIEAGSEFGGDLIVNQILGDQQSYGESAGQAVVEALLQGHQTRIGSAISQSPISLARYLSTPKATSADVQEGLVAEAAGAQAQASPPPLIARPAQPVAQPVAPMVAPTATPVPPVATPTVQPATAQSVLIAEAQSAQPVGETVRLPGTPQVQPAAPVVPAAPAAIPAATPAPAVAAAPVGKPTVEPGTRAAVSVGTDGRGVVEHIPAHIPNHENLDTPSLVLAHGAMEPAQAVNSIVALNAEAHRRSGGRKPSDPAFKEKVMGVTAEVLGNVAKTDQTLAVSTAEGISRMLDKQIFDALNNPQTVYNEAQLHDMLYRKQVIDSIANSLRTGSASEAYTVAGAQKFAADLIKAKKEAEARQKEAAQVAAQQVEAAASSSQSDAVPKESTDATPRKGENYEVEVGKLNDGQTIVRIKHKRAMHDGKDVKVIDTGVSATAVDQTMSEEQQVRWAKEKLAEESLASAEKSDREALSIENKLKSETDQRRREYMEGIIKAHRKNAELKRDLAAELRGETKPTASHQGEPIPVAKSSETVDGVDISEVPVKFKTRQWQSDKNSPQGGSAVDKEGEAPVVEFNGRLIVLRNVNGVQVPFYLSTGGGGKKDVPEGKWYPFFGVADGWLNKIGGKDMATYHGRADLATVARHLDKTLGDIRDRAGKGLFPAIGDKQSFEYINKGLSPVENGTPETRAKLEANIKGLFDRLDAASASKKQPAVEQAAKPAGDADLAPEPASASAQSEKPTIKKAVEGFKKMIEENLDHQKKNLGRYPEPSAEIAAKNIAAGAHNSADIIPSFSKDPKGHHEAMLALKEAAGLPEDYQFTSFGRYNSTKDFKARNDVRHWKPSEPIGAENPADVKERERLFREDANRSGEKSTRDENLAKSDREIYEDLKANDKAKWKKGSDKSIANAQNRLNNASDQLEKAQKSGKVAQKQLDKLIEAKAKAEYELGYLTDPDYKSPADIQFEKMAAAGFGPVRNRDGAFDVTISTNYINKDKSYDITPSAQGESVAGKMEYLVSKVRSIDEDGFVRSDKVGWFDSLEDAINATKKAGGELEPSDEPTRTGTRGEPTGRPDDDGVSLANVKNPYVLKPVPGAIPEGQLVDKPTKIKFNTKDKKNRPQYGDMITWFTIGEPKMEDMINGIKATLPDGTVVPFTGSIEGKPGSYDKVAFGIIGIKKNKWYIEWGQAPKNSYSVERWASGGGTRAAVIVFDPNNNRYYRMRGEIHGEKQEDIAKTRHLMQSDVLTQEQMREIDREMRKSFKHSKADAQVLKEIEKHAKEIEQMDEDGDFEAMEIEKQSAIQTAAGLSTKEAIAEAEGLLGFKLKVTKKQETNQASGEAVPAKKPVESKPLDGGAEWESEYDGPPVSIGGLTFTKEKLSDHYTDETSGDMYVVDLINKIPSKKGDIIQIGIKIKKGEIEIEFHEDSGMKYEEDGLVMPMWHTMADIVIPDKMTTVDEVVSALRNGTLKPGKMAKRFKAFLDLAESYQAKNAPKQQEQQASERPKQLGAGQGELLDTSDAFNLTGENVAGRQEIKADTTGEMLAGVEEPAYVAQARTQLAKLEKSGKSPEQQKTLRETIAAYEDTLKVKPEYDENGFPIEYSQGPETTSSESKRQSEYRENASANEVAAAILKHDYFFKQNWKEGQRHTGKDLNGIRPTAEIAEEMNVSIKAVSKIYQQLVKEGLLQANKGRRVETAVGSYTTTYVPAEGVTPKRIVDRLRQLASGGEPVAPEMAEPAAKREPMPEYKAPSMPAADKAVLDQANTDPSKRAQAREIIDKHKQRLEASQAKYEAQLKEWAKRNGSDQESLDKKRAEVQAALTELSAEPAKEEPLEVKGKKGLAMAINRQKTLIGESPNEGTRKLREKDLQRMQDILDATKTKYTDNTRIETVRRKIKELIDENIFKGRNGGLDFIDSPKVRDLMDRLKGYESKVGTVDQQAEAVSKPLHEGEPADITKARKDLSSIIRNMSRGEGWDAKRAEAEAKLEQYEAEYKMLSGEHLPTREQLDVVSNASLEEFVERFGEGEVSPEIYNAVTNEFMRRLDLRERAESEFGEKGKEVKGDMIGDITDIIRGSNGSIGIPTLPKEFGAAELNALRENLGPALANKLMRNPTRMGKLDAARAASDKNYRDDVKAAADGMLSDLAQALHDRGWTQFDPSKVSTDVMKEAILRAAKGESLTPEGGVLGRAAKDTASQEGMVERLYKAEKKAQSQPSSDVTYPSVNGDFGPNTDPTRLSEYHQAAARIGAVTGNAGKLNKVMQSLEGKNYALNKDEAEAVKILKSFSAGERGKIIELSKRPQNEWFPSVYAVQAWMLKNGKSGDQLKGMTVEKYIELKTKELGMSKNVDAVETFNSNLRELGLGEYVDRTSPEDPFSRRDSDRDGEQIRSWSHKDGGQIISDGKRFFAYSAKGRRMGDVKSEGYLTMSEAMWALKGNLWFERPSPTFDMGRRQRQIDVELEKLGDLLFEYRKSGDSYNAEMTRRKIKNLGDEIKEILRVGIPLRDKHRAEMDAAEKSIMTEGDWTEDVQKSIRDMTPEQAKIELRRRQERNARNKAGDPEVRKGYKGIVDRVVSEARLRGELNEKEIEGMTRILNMIGSEFFEGVKFKFGKGEREGEYGQYATASRIVSIFKDAIRSGRFEETAAHEIAHHLTRFLPEADRAAIRAELATKRTEFLKKNKGMERILSTNMKDWAKRRFTAKEVASANLENPTQHLRKLTSEELKKEGFQPDEAIYRLKLTDETYRLTNGDEYFAESFKDRVMSRLKSDPAYLGRPRNWKERLNGLWETIKINFRKMFGKETADRILSNFAKGRYNPDIETGFSIEHEGFDMSKRDRELKAKQVIDTQTYDEPIYPIGEAFVRKGDSTEVVNILGRNKMSPERAGQIKEFVKESSVKHALYRGQNGAYETLDANMSEDGLFHIAADPDYAAQYAYESNKSLPKDGTESAVIQVYINAKNIVDLTDLGHSIESRAKLQEMRKLDADGLTANEHIAAREDQFINRIISEVQRINTGKDIDVERLREDLREAFDEARDDHVNKFQTSIWQVFGHSSIHSLFRKYGVDAIKYSDSDLRTAKGGKIGGQESYVLADPRRIKAAFGENDVNPESSNIFQSKKDENMEFPGIDGSDRLSRSMKLSSRDTISESEFNQLMQGDRTFNPREWERVERTEREVIPPAAEAQRKAGVKPSDSFTERAKTVVEYKRKEPLQVEQEAKRLDDEIKAQDSVPDPTQDHSNKPGEQTMGSIRDVSVEQSEDPDVFREPRPGQSVARTGWDVVSGRYFSGISTKAHQNAERHDYSDTVKQIANMIHTRPGTKSEAYERDMPTAISTTRTKFHNRLNDILMPLRDTLAGFKDTDAGSARDQREKVYEALVDMITGRKQITSGELGKAASKLKGLLAELHEYRAKAGENIGEVQDYYPAVYDSPRIGENRKDFIRDARTAYEMTLAEAGEEGQAKALGMTKAEFADMSENDGQALKDALAELAENQAIALYNAHVRGASAEEFDSIFGMADRGAGENPALSRKFGRSAQDIMRKWQVNDPFRVVGRYITSSAKRAEVVRRFGNDGEKWKAMSNKMESDGVPYNIISEMRELVRKSAGIGSIPLGKASQTYVDTITLMTAASAMGRGFMNNLVEPVTIGMRTGSPIDILRAYAETWTRFLREIPALSKRLKAKMGETFWAEYGHEVGTIHNTLEDAWMTTHSFDLDAEYADPRFRWLTNRIYKANLMDASEVAKQQASHAIGFSFINKLGAMFRGDHWTSKLGLNAKQSVADQLSELGVKPEDHQAFADFTMKLENAKSDAERKAMMMGNDPMAELHREAMIRFSMQSSVRSSRAHKPVFQDTELGKTVLQLMNFSYSYAAEVNSRMYNMSKQAFMASPDGKNYSMYDRMRMLGPVAGGLLSILAYRGLLELKDLLYPSESSRQRAKDPELVKWTNATSYAGLLGPKFEQVMKAVKRDQAPGGPAGQMMVNLGRAAKSTIESAAEGKDMSAAQRSGAKALIPVLKGAAVASSAAAHPALGAVVTQATNSPMFRDALTPGKSDEMTAKELTAKPLNPNK